MWKRHALGRCQGSFCCKNAFSQIAELPHLHSVFLLPSFAFRSHPIVFHREEVLERGMVIIPDIMMQRWFGQASGCSFKLSWSAVKTNVTGLGLTFVVKTEQTSTPPPAQPELKHLYGCKT